jgi:hypothetical protein
MNALSLRLRTRSRLPLVAWTIATAVVATATRTTAQPPANAAAAGPVVELPAVMVEESSSAPPWLYAKANGTEYLSRCSEANTRRYIEGWSRALQVTETLVPEALLHRSAIPSVTILYSQQLSQTTSPELLRELKPDRPTDASHAGAPYSYRFAPNMRLEDRDMYATFAYIDENTFATTLSAQASFGYLDDKNQENRGAKKTEDASEFEARWMSATPGYVRFLLERRAPALPAWFIEGFDGVYRRTRLARGPIVFGKFFWVEAELTANLTQNEQYPRALLPASELFASDALRGPLNGNPKRVATMKAQVALFVRWALATSAETRAALWKFAALTAEQPATPELFAACFGFGYAELRDRLSDYLPQAVRDAPRVDTGKLPPLEPLTIRRATPGEIARLRGEWERLAIAYVRTEQPQVQERYVFQARRTLRRAYDAGIRDPELLATMGLCEVAADDRPAAIAWLEKATAAGVVRPRAYQELARLRLAELRRAQPSGPMTAAQLGPVLDLLRSAARQEPLLPEIFTALGEIWARHAVAPTTDDFALLEHGARTFARFPSVNLPLALALARHGRKEQASALLTEGLDYVYDEATRERFTGLRNSLGVGR